ncbi:MAG: magnesium transporter CorA family protein [Actinomycetota bacterium]|nr:magnesium transporter CorA family protein [Actinomycetota bacterium]
MGCRVVDRNGAAEEATLDRARLEQRLAEGFFWLDLQRPSRQDLELLHEVLDLHPLAIEDSFHFGQRPKLEQYETFDFLVVYGHAPDEDDLVEVHLYVSDRFLLAVRRDDAPALDALHGSYARGRSLHRAAPVVYAVVDALVDSFFPPLDGFEERLTLIEDELLRSPKEELLQDVFAMKRRVARLRRVVVPQRDVFGRIASGAAELPGATPETERYFRDIYDHLVRLGETLETSAELMAAAIDIYLSSSSRRLNEVMKQITVIAAIFLPLTFVTGFFGQNFGWMTRHIDGATAFFLLGIGLEVTAIVLLLTYFRRRDWF